MTAHDDPCSRVSAQVEAMASGDLDVDGALRGHLESCPRCAGELAAARRIETLLSSREAPAAPPRFTAAVLAAVRRERWRAEQRVDALFNLAIAAAVLLMVAGIVAILNVGSVLAAAGTVWSATSAAAQDALSAERPGPSLATYAGAAAFMISGLVMWWWAERRFSM